MTKAKTRARHGGAPKFWQAPGYTFQVHDAHGNPWPPGFVPKLTTPTPTESSRVAISHKAHANRRARLQAGADPLAPPIGSSKAA